MRRLVLGLNAATVLLVLAGIVLLIVPLPAPAGRVTDSLASVTPAPDSVSAVVVADVGAAERVVKTDIFSPRRGPPTRRYAFGETSESADATVSEVTAAPALAGEPLDSAAASTASDAVPHLYGTMMGPNDATALLRLDANLSEPRLYRVGDRAGGYRVADISDRSVTLVGRSGRVVLRLIRREQ
ncbi:MAG TPA: hypothetical protein VM076_18890 [Gemmatimonadaceae bacterium]|nr:hypothetical protein [Gemmatimonadaceae bacterium]